MAVMETKDANADETPGMHLGATVVGIGLLATVGSIFVLVGTTDTLAFLSGSRPPGTWMPARYFGAFLTAAVGWSLLVVAVLGVVRAARSV
jgi:hypothetical protein